MSGAVDVLRALDKAVFHTGGWPGATFPEVHADLIQARAAVAELIEEAHRVADGLTDDMHYLRAAVARCGGSE